ncbi:MAG: MBL fold metallo-hydrolase [Hydrogenophaga sp.]|jgi:flavorubredoxin|uniref:MBL fold metallo-hydrolase n=1 Tax=Hydrogenophaga sp. TaxID=1904254 RepID=UPI0026389E12|nr:MBL fold metallo-hydrolase [Hydrogenophaga sp.]MCV0438145.1 MBL fold metallo-hydrolase [Hydrogenophaga sp.]
MITNTETRTNVHEIADGIYRINTPIDAPDGSQFSFNQYLLLDDEPLLFHTGGRSLFPLVSAAIAAVMPIERLRWIGFSHTEADECGSLNQLLAVAPQAVPLSGHIAAMVSTTDMADRAPRVLADGELLHTGRRTLQWFDTPHVPHGWDAGLLMETTTKTLLCGDLFTQPGYGEQALTEADILGPSEAFRTPMDYYAHAPQTKATLLRLAQQSPQTLACMHGSAWRGDGAALLQALAASVTQAH